MPAREPSQVEQNNKNEVLEKMLAKGDTMLCVDSQHPEVQVPDAHRGDPDLRLILNLGFRHGIRVLQQGIEAELLFGGLPHTCWIPFDSLWAVYNPHSGEGYLWPSSVPKPLRGTVDSAASPASSDPEEVRSGRLETAPPLPPEKGKPPLRLIRGGRKD